MHLGSGEQAIPAGFFARAGFARPGPTPRAGTARADVAGVGAPRPFGFALTAVMIPYPLYAAISTTVRKGVFHLFTLESAAASHIDPTPGLVTGISYVGRRPGTGASRGNVSRLRRGNSRKGH